MTQIPAPLPQDQLLPLMLLSLFSMGGISSDTTHVLAAASAGSGMSSAQVSAYYGALQTYMAAGEPTQWAADVNFAGDGAIAASATVLGTTTQWAADATFAGTSSLVASAGLLLSATASFAGDGAIAASASVLGATTQWDATASFAGSSSLSTYVDLWLSTSAQFAGAGSATVNSSYLAQAIHGGVGHPTFPTYLDYLNTTQPDCTDNNYLSCSLWFRTLQPQARWN